MLLEICMQIYSVVFALSRQINKQNVCENAWSPCEGNKVFVKYHAQGGFNPNPPHCVRPCIGQIGLKLPLVEKRWLAAFIVTCKLGLAVGLGFIQLHVYSVIP